MKKGATEAVANKGKHFIDILLNVQKDGTTDFTFQRDTVKAIILDVFVGGIDTAATSLEWVRSELVRHPGVGL
ncbi:putative indoleacetaldoxime dehydratase [Helianthus annuus]|nr:putative indoleacetaldoxime dehydratase [Helianthus annuus]